MIEKQIWTVVYSIEATKVQRAGWLRIQTYMFLGHLFEAFIPPLL